jgi:pimeloyl-ACP methyl ester carboxylesterase
LGPEGEIHPYLSAAAEGHAVIDGVAAVRNLPDAHAGDRWVVAGVSQGGHAALVTNEMAAERLPDAELVGAVALAPGSQLGRTFGDDLQVRVITTLVLVGRAAEDPTVRLADYVSPEVQDAATIIERECIGAITTGMVGVATSPDYFRKDPRTDSIGKEWLEQNDPGQVVAESPLLVVQGGQDVVVLPARTDALMEQLCGIGQVVERIDVPAADHNSVVTDAGDQVSEWIAARFAGTPAPSGC